MNPLFLGMLVTIVGLPIGYWFARLIVRFIECRTRKAIAPLQTDEDRAAMLQKLANDESELAQTLVAENHDVWLAMDAAYDKIPVTPIEIGKLCLAPYSETLHAPQEVETELTRVRQELAQARAELSRIEPTKLEKQNELLELKVADLQAELHDVNRKHEFFMYQFTQCVEAVADNAKRVVAIQSLIARATRKPQ